MAQNRARNWNLVLNGDNLPNTNEIIAKLAEIRAKNYAFIYHNKDNEDKRKHIHLVIEFENARTFESLKKKLDAWHIEPCRNLALSLQYLTHKNAPDKEQYEIDDVIKSNDNWFNTYWSLGQNYVNDEKELMRDIMQGKYHNILEIVLSDKYSMEWLQHRWKIVEEVFFWLNKEPWKYEKDLTEDLTD